MGLSGIGTGILLYETVSYFQEASTNSLRITCRILSIFLIGMLSVYFLDYLIVDIKEPMLLVALFCMLIVSSHIGWEEYEGILKLTGKTGRYSYSIYVMQQSSFSKRICR